MRKSAIMAMTPSGVIGYNGRIPWNIPEDLRRFKRLTMGKPVIMGRKTYESIGKLLPGRTNIIVTRNDDYQVEDAKVADSVLEAWVQAATTGADEAFVIGGEEIYRQCLGTCDRFYLTVLEAECPGDVRFIQDLTDWTITEREYVSCLIPHHNLILDRNSEMTQMLTLERMEKNTLHQPRYGTLYSAGIDFAACLTRPCKSVEEACKKEFWAGSVWKEPVPWGVDETIQEMQFHKRLDAPEEQPAEPALLVQPGETIMIPLGWKCSFGLNVHMQIHVRSSIGIKGLVLANGTGIVDADYRGELFAVVRNVNKWSIEVKHGERIVQGILVPYQQAIVKEGKVDDTERGEGGFGSTGVMGAATASNPQLESTPATT